jgi:hypothetical protein
MAHLYRKRLLGLALLPSLVFAAPGPGYINIKAPSAIQYTCSGEACDGQNSGSLIQKTYTLQGNQSIVLELYDPRGALFCSLKGHEIASCFRGVCGYRLTTSVISNDSHASRGYSCKDSGEPDWQNDTLSITTG